MPMVHLLEQWFSEVLDSCRLYHAHRLSLASESSTVHMQLDSKPLIWSLSVKAILALLFNTGHCMDGQSSVKTLPVLPSGAQPALESLQGWGVTCLSVCKLFKGNNGDAFERQSGVHIYIYIYGLYQVHSLWSIPSLNCELKFCFWL